ncbi:MAG: AraC family transcriptional regulator [Sphaerochaeta sp.]
MNESNLLIKAARFVGLDGVRKSSIDLSLSYCGIQQCSPLHNNGPEIRNTSFIHIILSGQGVFKINGCVYHLSQGEAFFIPSGINAQYTADKDNPWKYIWVGFSGLMGMESLLRAGFSLRCPVRKVGFVDKLQRDVEGMIDAYHLTCANEFRRTGYFFNFIADLMEDYLALGTVGSVCDSHSATYARQAYYFIMNNFSQPIKIEEMASSIGISRNYLFTCFKELYEVSPKQFLNSVRMEHASSMLISSYLQISQVARNVGFEDELAFSRAFKDYYDVCPSEFRRLNGNTV